MDNLRTIEETIRANRQAFSVAAANHRSDPAGLKAVFDKAMSRHTDLRRQHYDAVAQTREQLLASASKMPAANTDVAQLNQRDALARASAATTAGELRRFVVDAQRAGDLTGIRAGVHAAVSRGWTGILGSVDDADAQALLSFESEYGSQASAATKFMRSAALSAPVMPGRMR